MNTDPIPSAAPPPIQPVQLVPPAQPAQSTQPVQPVQTGQPAAAAQTPSSLSTINYQPLGGVGAKMMHQLFHTRHILLFAVLLLGVVITVLAKSPSALVGAIFISLVWFSILRASARKAAWADFAAVNNWSLSAAGSPEEVIPPSLAFGHNQVCSDVINTSLAALPARIFTYRTIVGEGKNSHTYNYTLAVVAVPKTMPHLQLEPKLHWAANTVRNDLADRETLKLEGDFNNYYTLEVEKGTEVDVLTVMTPDVMQAAVQYGEKLAIEILGQNLFFIMERDAETDPQHLQQLFTATVSLSGQIIENIRLAGGGTPQVQAPAPAQVSAPQPSPGTL